MEPHGLSAAAVARACRVPRTRIERIAGEKTGITTDTALRLEKLFGATAAFWLGLQADYELAVVRDAIAPEIAVIEPVAA